MYLYAITALARSHKDHPALHSVLRGDIRTATRLAQQHSDEDSNSLDPSAAMHWATLCGDLMLAQDHDEDAEQAYRRALRGAAGCTRGQSRVAACRNTGFMNLYQQRFGTAVACFQRVVDDEATSAAGKVEALCGLAAAQHAMGDAGHAQHTLQSAAQRSRDSSSSELNLFTDLWHADLLVQQSIRGHAALQDHIFWRSPVTHVQATGLHGDGPARAMAAVDACMARHPALPLVAQRLQHLRDLLLAVDGDMQALRNGQAHVQWLARAGLLACERQARLEWALVSLATKNVDVARSMLDPLTRGSDSASRASRPVRRWDFELSYCRAKLCGQQGLVDESLRFYQLYALESVLCLRSENPAPQDAREAGAASSPVKDEVEMSLPAKYRRAYRYMLDKLGNADLSVHELAEHVGVTERALQSAFKLHLGMSPAQLLRRCRLERIRRELLRDDAPAPCIGETAERFGIRNRSTLVAAYRQQFNETPAQTLARRHPAHH
jgi:AraC-like DNA-binding protein